MMSPQKLIKYMKLAKFNADLFSKDTSTKVGALLIAPNSHEILSMGYNGMPRGCDDTKPERLERPEKYFWAEHAERNAIYNAARKGTPLEGSIAIVTLMPCIDCARGLVQAGISEVVTIQPDSSSPLYQRWDTHFEKTKELFNEVGINLILLNQSDLD